MISEWWHSDCLEFLNLSCLLKLIGANLPLVLFETLKHLILLQFLGVKKDIRDNILFYIRTQFDRKAGKIIELARSITIRFSFLSRSDWLSKTWKRLLELFKLNAKILCQRMVDLLSKGNVWGKYSKKDINVTYSVF